MKRSKRKQRSEEAAAAAPPESGTAGIAVPESLEGDIIRSASEPGAAGRFSIDGIRVLQAIGVVFAAACVVWLVFREFLHIL